MASPEQRRDAAVGAIIAAGGVVRGTVPLAHPDAPHTIVAYRILAGSPRASVRPAVEAVREDTETELTGLIPWEPDPIEEVVGDEGSDPGHEA